MANLQSTYITGSLLASGSNVDFTSTSAISGSIFSGSFIGDGSGLTGTGGGGGIFALTGSTYATTNDLEITGSLEVTGAITASMLALGGTQYTTTPFSERPEIILNNSTNGPSIVGKDTGWGTQWHIANFYSGTEIGTYTGTRSQNNLYFSTYDITRMAIDPYGAISAGKTISTGEMIDYFPSGSGLIISGSSLAPIFRVGAYTTSSAPNEDLFLVDGRGDIKSIADHIITGSLTVSGSTVVLSSKLNQGLGNESKGNYSHAEGQATKAQGEYSHTEGLYTTASGNYSHAEGEDTIATGDYSHAEGRYTRAQGTDSHAEGYNTTSSGNYAHAEGFNVVASSTYAHAEGGNTFADGEISHAEGSVTTASAEGAHSEGEKTIASGKGSHSEGFYTTASGDHSHAEGFSTISSGDQTHAEGGRAKALGDWSHAEGQDTRAQGHGTHAEGRHTSASGVHSHAEGGFTLSSGSHSHAEGYFTTSSGIASHAEGSGSAAKGDYSHASGISTIASGSGQNTVGHYNTHGNDSAFFIIGKGTSDGARADLLVASGSTVSVTGSLIVTGSISGSDTIINPLTASYAITASHALNAGGGGSTFPFTGDAVITGSLTLSGSNDTWPFDIQGKNTGKLRNGFYSWAGLSSETTDDDKWQTIGSFPYTQYTPKSGRFLVQLFGGSGHYSRIAEIDWNFKHQSGSGGNPSSASFHSVINNYGTNALPSSSFEVLRDGNMESGSINFYIFVDEEYTQPFITSLGNTDFQFSSSIVGANLSGETDAGFWRKQINNGITIDSNNFGYIGIGTTSPTTTLDIEGNTVITGSLTVSGSNTSITNTSRLRVGEYFINGGTDIGSGEEVYVSGSGIQRMAIDSSDNSAVLQLRAPAGQPTLIDLEEGGEQRWTIGCRGDNDFYISSGSSLGNGTLFKIDRGTKDVEIVNNLSASYLYTTTGNLSSISASYALTASHALNSGGGGGGIFGQTGSYYNTTNFLGISGSLQISTITSGGTTSNILKLIGSGSVSGSGLLEVEGSTGTLFSATDSMTGSLMSVTDVSGIPILEVFSDNTVTANGFKGWRPYQSQSASFTLQLTDMGTYNRCGGVAITASLSASSAIPFALGTEIEFIQTSSAGNLLITASAGSGVTINSKNDNLNLAGQWSAATLKKVDTDTWDLVGDLT